MSREWKPGDVAAWDFEDGSGSERALRTAHDWFGERGSVPKFFHDSLRPLVVIDPENREQVERLCAAMKANGWTGIDDEAPDDMQTALRSLLEPERPEEPKGKYAVVQDASGAEWVRCTNEGRSDWLRAGWFTSEEWTDWSEIRAVKVLSEGVS